MCIEAEVVPKLTVVMRFVIKDCVLYYRCLISSATLDLVEPALGIPE